MAGALSSTTRTEPRVAPLSGAQRLVIFATLLGLAGGAIWFGPLHNVVRPNAAFSMPWWGELLACYAASLFYVEVGVRRTRSTLSLTEIPVVVGLFLVDPRMLLGAYVVGVLLGHWTRRGIQPARDYSNAMLDVLYMAVTVLVFTAIRPDAVDPLAPRSLLAVAGAMAAAGWIVGPIALNAGIYLYQGGLPRAELAREFLLQFVSTTTNSCLGVVALLFIAFRPWLAFVAVPPALLVVAAQLSGMESQRRADRMEFLYRTSDILHSTVRVNDRAGELLGGMSRMFGMARVELLVMPEERGPAVRFTLRGGGDHAEMSQSELTFAEQEALNLLRTRRLVGASQAETDTPLALLLAERAVQSGIVVALRGRERPQGMLLLAEGVNRRSRLGAQEENLLLTVAGQISVALEAGHLAGAIRTMSAANDELQRRAFYDPLTQIANRSLFTETVGQALNRFPSARRPLATLFIDLDGFKQVNDTFGHAVGDKVLHTVAGRLRSLIRKFDMPARIGGDEFGLLLETMRHRGDAELVARRVVEALRRPILVGDSTVAIGGSVGVAVVDDPEDVPPPEELLRRADMAMYLAKRQGKDRYVVFDTGARSPVIASGGEYSAQTATG